MSIVTVDCSLWIRPKLADADYNILKQEKGYKYFDHNHEDIEMTSGFEWVDVDDLMNDLESLAKRLRRKLSRKYTIFGNILGFSSYKDGSLKDTKIVVRKTNAVIDENVAIKAVRVRGEGTSVKKRNRGNGGKKKTQKKNSQPLPNIDDIFTDDETLTDDYDAFPPPQDDINEPRPIEQIIQESEPTTELESSTTSSEASQQASQQTAPKTNVFSKISKEEKEKLKQRALNSKSTPPPKAKEPEKAAAPAKRGRGRPKKKA